MTLDQFIPGRRVYILTQLHPEIRLGGQVGRMWDKTPPSQRLEASPLDASHTIIVQFDNGVMVAVKEKHAHLFHLEPTN